MIFRDVNNGNLGPWIIKSSHTSKKAPTDFAVIKYVQKNDSLLVMNAGGKSFVNRAWLDDNVSHLRGIFDGVFHYLQRHDADYKSL